MALIPALQVWSQFKKLMPKAAHAGLEDAFESVRTLYRSLEAIVFNHYVRMKTLGLNALIKHGMVSRLPSLSPASGCSHCSSFSLIHSS
jgi:hypothetical protein